MQHCYLEAKQAVQHRYHQMTATATLVSGTGCASLVFELLVPMTVVTSIDVLNLSRYYR